MSPRGSPTAAKFECSGASFSHGRDASPGRTLGRGVSCKTRKAQARAGRRSMRAHARGLWGCSGG
eukprot:CAMPEP_0198499748 /NCGR_PEP_ID=MMETSP1462-20131121/7800_1 /TAXON_ID=1333877 /ORGANISM="Brandtodinium nutriculum, Strain RCC3387" /LENGTH=64 /DNA_ID=CAMNT_0044228739 /DNA_START=114 /DNA_END=305 /DNA_ORIENTATION=+